jgi:hypothetical protein
MEVECYCKRSNVGFKVVANVISIKGTSNVDHRVGESFEMSIHNAGNLCGSFCHNIFPDGRPSSSVGVCPVGKGPPYNYNARISMTW